MFKNKELISILNLRKEIFNDYMKKKMSYNFVGNRTYMFIQQYKIQYVKKAYAVDDIVLNYFYWQAHIERRVAVERVLTDLEVHSIDRLNHVLFLYKRRRDQMVRRMFIEGNLEAEEMKLIGDDLVEIKFKGIDFPVFSSRSSLKKIKINVKFIKNTGNPCYLPFIIYEKRPCF